MVKITHRICFIFNCKLHTRIAYEGWYSWLTIIFKKPVVGVTSICLRLGPGIEMLRSLSLSFALSDSLSSLLDYSGILSVSESLSFTISFTASANSSTVLNPIVFIFLDAMLQWEV